jgi:transcription elongation factor GreB
VSKAFTKEDAEEELVVVAPRAPLPAGVVNYVTPRGLHLLRAELAEFQAERARIDATLAEAARARALSVLAERKAELERRVASAVVVLAEPHRGEVRFGTHVRVRGEDQRERRYQIVGVDEADASHGRVAFVAPLARALLGRKPGDVAVLRTPKGDEELEVLGIE